MTVRVRMFAAVREAAGLSEVELEAGRLVDLLSVLMQRHGEVFERRLAISTVLVDGDAWPSDDQRVVPDGAEIALLPPVSGGS